MFLTSSMSSAHRRTGEIEVQILELCLDGVGKTFIVYSLNLNFAAGNRHLKSLLGETAAAHPRSKLRGIRGAAA